MLEIKNKGKHLIYYKGRFEKKPTLKLYYFFLHQAFTLIQK